MCGFTVWARTTHRRSAPAERRLFGNLQVLQDRVTRSSNQGVFSALCSAVRCPTLPWPAAADWLTAADCLALQSTLQY